MTPTPNTPQTPAKAVIAAVLVALTALLATLQGRTDLESMGVIAWLIVVVSAIVAGLTVYTIPNKQTGA